QTALSAAEADRSAAARNASAVGAAVSALRALEAAAAETRKRRDVALSAVAEGERDASAHSRRADDLIAKASIDAREEARAGRVRELEREERELEEARAGHDGLAGEAAALEGRIREEAARIEADAAGVQR